MSPLLRRLGVTQRRTRADLEHALEVAETDRDIARGERDRLLGIVEQTRGVLWTRGDYDVRSLDDLPADVLAALQWLTASRERLAQQSKGWERDVAARAAERDAAHEAIGKVADAAGRPGAPTRWNVEDLVQWVAAAGKVEDQRDTLGAELVAVDEALAAAGVDWTDDRATGIRDLADRRAQDAHKHFGQAADALVDVLGLTSCVRDGCGHARHQHAEAGECRGVLAGTRGAPCRCEAFDDGVVDARIVDARSLETGGGPVCGACGTPYPCPEHQPDALAAKRAAPTPLPTCRCYWCELVREQCRPVRPGVWCTAHLDGAHCSRPAGHTEPCRPVEPSPVARSSLLPTGAELDAPEAARRWLINHSGLGPAQARSASSSALLRLVRDSAWLMSGDLDDLARVERTLTPVFPGVPVAQCSATGEPVAGRCERVAGHPGDHEWAAV